MLAHSSILVTAFVIAVMVLIASGVRDLLGFTMLDRPVFICPIVGWLFGDIQQGLLIGASLEAVFMGIVNIGGASAAECGIASVVGCAFAIMSGGGPEVALPLALPIGMLGQQAKNIIWIGIIGWFAPVFDKLAENGEDKKLTRLHYGLWCLNWGLYCLIPFFAILFGSKAVEAAVKAIPAVIMNGLTVCGNLLPAVGMAMLLKLLWNNKIYVYFFLGFVLVAYLKLPLIALAALGVIAALLVAQRDLELNQLLRVKAAAAPAAVPAQGILDEEEEDFFNV